MIHIYMQKYEARCIDGGFNTATTSSRLRALGADYSTNNKLCGCKLTSQKEMLNLRYYGKKTIS